MKKIFFGIFLLLLLCSGGYFYFKYFRETKPEIWQLVPSNAFMAYESHNAGNAWNSLIQKPLWNTTSAIPFFHDVESEIRLLDSISGGDGSLDKLFRNFGFVASFHITSSTTFDVIYFLDLTNPQNQKTVNRIVNTLEGNFAFNQSERKFQEFTINEIKKKGDDRKFSFLLYEDYFVGTFSSMLLEDVVRNIDSEYQNSFANRINDLKELSKLEDDEGNIYIDFNRVAAAVDIFIDKNKSFPFRELGRMAENSFLDFKLTDNELLFNGTTNLPEGHPGYFLSIFNQQNPGSIEMQKLMSENTAVFVHYSFSDLEKWKQNLGRYWSSTDEKLLNNWLDFESEYEFTFDWMDGEVGLAIMESINADENEKLILIEAKDTDKAYDLIKNLAVKDAEKEGDSIYTEEYNDHEIVQLSIQEWPQLFLGRLFSGFDNSFVTTYEDYILVGSSIRVIKNFVRDNQEENTWGKSVRHNLFLENTLNESSFTVLINTEKAWGYIINLLNEDWKSTFNAYEPQIKSFDRLAFQFSNLDEDFYTSIAVGHKKVEKSKITTSRFNTLSSTYTLKEIVTKPYLVKNHNNKRWEVMVQDQANILYLISNEGMVLWGDSLGTKIVTDIYQIDYYKNNKLQYLFATHDKIHLLDRNGHYVENFPIQLKSGVKADKLSVIDYDNSKNYRFMVSDEGGDIYLYDKEKNNLEGWTPRDLSGSLTVPGKHIRVKGGDCMIALQNNGILNIMNRRGNMISGFPFDFKGDVTGEMYIDIGNNYKSTTLTTITKEGEKVSINLRGDVIKREQMYKPTKESRFWLVVDALEKTYLIVRQAYNSLAFFNSNGDLLFEKNIIGSDNLQVQYYYFSSEKQLIIVTDPEQEFTYIYNENGDLINLEPLESGFPISVLYYANENTYHFYKSFGNNVSVLTADD